MVFDLEKVPKDWEDWVTKVGLLKRNCFASVFEKYFQFQEEGTTGHKRAVIQYRDDETMYVSVVRAEVPQVLKKSLWFILYLLWNCDKNSEIMSSDSIIQRELKIERYIVLSMCKMGNGSSFIIINGRSFGGNKFLVLNSLTFF